VSDRVDEELGPLCLRVQRALVQDEREAWLSVAAALLAEDLAALSLDTGRAAVAVRYLAEEYLTEAQRAALEACIRAARRTIEAVNLFALALEIAEHETRLFFTRRRLDHDRWQAPGSLTPFERLVLRAWLERLVARWTRHHHTASGAGVIQLIDDPRTGLPGLLMLRPNERPVRSL
jgi:hypothetical protein